MKKLLTISFVIGFLLLGSPILGQVKDSITVPRFQIGLPLLTYFKPFTQFKQGFGLAIGMRINPKTRGVLTYNNYGLSYPLTRQAPNYTKYQIEGNQVKFSLQHLVNSEDYDKIKILFGLQVGFAKNQLNYAYTLQEQNFYTYKLVEVSEKSNAANLAAQIGGSFLFLKHFELSTTGLLGLKHRWPNPSLDGYNRYPMLGIGGQRVYASIEIDLWYRF
jgi:hypothetical protein